MENADTAKTRNSAGRKCFQQVFLSQIVWIHLWISQDDRAGQVEDGDKKDGDKKDGDKKDVEAEI